MGLITDIEGMWGFATMGNCGGESKPIIFGIDENEHSETSSIDKL